MYKTIIVDDEESVRVGLRDHFDWEFHGVTVVDIFPDCAKAYEYVRGNPVDLVITDVITPTWMVLPLPSTCRRSSLPSKSFLSAATRTWISCGEL